MAKQTQEQPEDVPSDNACVVLLLAAAIFFALSVGFVASCEKETTSQYEQTRRLRIEKGLEK